MISDNDILNPYYPIILIGWLNNIHYILIFPKDHPKDLIYNLIIHDKSILANYNEYYTNCNQTIIIDKIKSKYKNNDKNIKKNNKKEETLALEPKNKKPLNIKDSGKYPSNTEMLKYKDFLSTYVKNNNSIFPVLNGTKYGEKKLEFIYNYLLSEKNINNKEK